LIKTPYFDAIALSNNEADRRRFVDLSIAADVSTQPDTMKAFYDMVAKYTTETPPAVIG
jgi:hypothetical protein